LGQLRGLFDGFEDVSFGIEGDEALGAGAVEEHGRCRDEDDFGAAKHFARDECCAELKGIGPSQAGAVEELASGFKDGWIEGLLHHAGGFDAQDFESGCSVLAADVACTLAPADGGIDLERSGGGDELAIVLDGLHETDEDVGPGLLHEELCEGRGLEEVAVHNLPRSS